jgi:hypothetical protein
MIVMYYKSMKSTTFAIDKCRKYEKDETYVL